MFKHSFIHHALPNQTQHKVKIPKYTYNVICLTGIKQICHGLQCFFVSSSQSSLSTSLPMIWLRPNNICCTCWVGLDFAEQKLLILCVSEKFINLSVINVSIYFWGSCHNQLFINCKREIFVWIEYLLLICNYDGGPLICT